MKTWGKLRDTVCGVQGTRTGALVSTVVGALSKPVGYLRTLLLAWLFGASAGMDAFYLAMGILSLIGQIVSDVAESALLPRLPRLGEERSKALLARAFLYFAIGVLLVSLGVLAFPRACVTFFARRFDAARLETASAMLRLLVPWAVGAIMLSLLSVWNVYRGRYSLNITLMCLGHATLIPLIFFLSRVLGVYAVPASFSLMFAVLFLTVFRLTGDFPVRAPAVSLPEGTWRSLGWDCLLCLGIVGADSLYQLVDRYFAAALPPGNISAINYAGQIYMLPLGLLAPALLIYLGRASALAADPLEARNHLGSVMVISWLYLFPPSLALVCLAPVVVKLLLGYGAFDARAVAMTAPCMAAAAWALPLLMWGQILTRYARACGRLRTILVVSWGALALNAFLDWLFVPRWGAPGLCAATGLTWGGSALVYSLLLVRPCLRGVLGGVWKGTAAFAAGALLVAAAGLSPVWTVAGEACALAVYFLLGERLGFFEDVPGAWRPAELLRLMLRGTLGLRQTKNE
jgi:peptidoglycan biosynthesis protein MviN/MurJ (putative lipid II flippase)